MKPKIVLHIGQSKTGTSAIQSFLTLNRKRLLEHNVLYPVPYVSGMAVEIGSHNAVADALLDHMMFPNLTADQYFQQFFQQCEDTSANLMILSAEHFFGGQPRFYNVRDMKEYNELHLLKLDRLSKYIGDHDVHIIVYLRPQVEWLASAFNQSIKTEGLREPGQENYVSDRAYLDFCKPGLLYGPRLDAWANAFPNARLEVVPYIRSALKGQNAAIDFAHRAGIGHIETPNSIQRRTINDSLTREYLEVKKILNKNRVSKSEERARIFVLRELSRKSKLGTEYRIEEDVIRDLEAYVAEDNLSLSARYLQGKEPFSARSSYSVDRIPPLGAGEVDAAMAAFEKAYARPAIKLRIAREAIKAFLRRHAQPVHAVLHHGKRIYVQYKIKQWN